MILLICCVVLGLIAGGAVVLAPELAADIARMRRSLPGRAGRIPPHPRYGSPDASAPTFAVRADGLVTADKSGSTTVSPHKPRHAAGLPRRGAEFDGRLTRPIAAAS